MAVADRAGIGFVDILPRLNAAAFNSALAAQAQPALASAGSTLSSKISSGVKSLSYALGAPIGAIGAAVGVAAIGKLTLSFEDAFTRIDALSNASAEDISRWRDSVLTLSGETAQSPTDLANALYFLASAGLRADQVFPALEASAKGAAVGLGDTATVASVMASVLNAYSQEGLTAAHVTDVLVAAVREGRAEPDEFAQAFGRVLPLASAAGVSFDEVAASLASLSNIGLDVEEGTTALRSLLRAMVAPATEAGQALADMGVSSEELRRVLSEEGLLAAIDLLQEKTHGNIDELRKVIPNIRALAAQLGITSQSAEIVAGVFERVAHSSGDMAAAFLTTTQGPAFQFRELLNDIRVVLLQIGEAILPVATKVVEAFSTILKPVGEVLHFLGEIPGVIDLITYAIYGFLALRVYDVLTSIAVSASAAATATGELAVAEGVAGGAAYEQTRFNLGLAASNEAVAVSAGGALKGIGLGVAGLARMAVPIAIAGASIRAAAKTFDLFKTALQGATDIEVLRKLTDTIRLFGINVPHFLAFTTTEAKKLKGALSDLNRQVTLGNVTATDAIIAYQTLGEQIGITFSDKFLTGVAIQADFARGANLAQQITYDFATALDSLKENAIRDGHEIGKLGHEFIGFAEALGEDGQAALAEWHAAVRKSLTDNGEAMREFIRDIESSWNDFKANVREGLDFTGDAISTLESTAQSARDQLAGDISGLGSAELAQLRADANLTAQEILRSFQESRKQTISFGRDLLEISRTGGQAGKDLAQAYLEAGSVIQAQVVADAPKKMQDQLIQAFGRQESAADKFSTKLTNSIIGPLETIENILKRIAQKWEIQLSASVDGTDEVSNLLRKLQGIRDVAGHHLVLPGGRLPPATAEVDVSLITGQHGFVTRGPVFQVGEAGSEVVDPLESPRATRLRAQSMADALKLLGVSPSLGSNDVRVHLTVGIDSSGNLHVRRIAQDEVQREARYRERVSA